MKRVFVTGHTGLLGGYLSGIGERVDIRDESAVDALFDRVRPDVVLHAAALAAAADCARDPELAWAVNVRGTEHVARACARLGIRLVYVSTDLVFDGERAPYREADPPRPLSVYGRTKAEGELRALGAPNAVVARISLLYGPSRNARRGFFDAQLMNLREAKPITLFDDEWRTPLSYAAAAEALTALAVGTATGIVHCGGPERMTRWEMGERLARHLGLDASCIHRGSRLSVRGEPRPRDTSLVSNASVESLDGPRSFEEECDRMLRETKTRDP